MTAEDFIIGAAVVGRPGASGRPANWGRVLVDVWSRGIQEEGAVWIAGRRTGDAITRFRFSPTIDGPLAAGVAIDAGAGGTSGIGRIGQLEGEEHFVIAIRAVFCHRNRV